VSILDNIARDIKGQPDTWAELDPGTQLFWIMMLISVPFGILGMLISII